MSSNYASTPVITSNPGDVQSKLTDSNGIVLNPAKEDGNLASIKTDLDTLSSTVSGGKVQTTATSVPNFGTQSDTFTAPGNGTTVDKHTAPVKLFSIQVKGTGAAATAWTVVLEASLDGVNFSTVLTHSLSIGDGQVLWVGALESPALYFRSRASLVTLGSATNIVVTVLGM